MWPFSSSPEPASSPAPAAASSAADKCPVSEETRVQWLAAAKARNQSAESPHQAAAAASSTPVPAAAPAPAPTPLVSAPPAAPEDACPVDENTRLKWLAAQKAGGQATSPHPPSSPFATAAASSSSSSSKAPSTADALSLEREVSSIPRVSTADLPQLSEHADTAAFYTPEQQHWVYPSEQQFYAAMERKQHNPSAVDMKTLVPIHNAVNEEAWRAVRAWEHGLGGDGCGGIKLKTFKGTPGALTPKSFVNRFLFGYQAPFDTHRWLVSRCGTEVEYIIDFYAGRNADFGFHLDVRPALGSWEGWRTRFGPKGAAPAAAEADSAPAAPAPAAAA